MASLISSTVAAAVTEQVDGSSSLVDPVTGVVTAPTRRQSAGVSMKMPGVADGRASTARDGLTMLPPDNPHYTSAVATTEAGAFRGLLHINSAEAPTEYFYNLGLPRAARLKLRPDGGVDVRGADGYVFGSFATPWALDAAGKPVATRYRVRGSTLVQHVSLTSSSVYPVVADPFWIPALFVMARLSSHVLQQAASRKISQELIRQVVENGKRTAGHSDRSVFTQGKGANRIRVIVENKTGEIVTVTKG